MNGRSPTLLVTGGAGFIGSAFVRHCIRASDYRIVNLDLLTYAGDLRSLEEVADDPRHTLERVDIRDAAAVQEVFARHKPDVVLHLAAETHVDRSIDDPEPFVTTNVVGTFNMLEAARRHWTSLDAKARTWFRFHHVSTDEVYGDVGGSGACIESTAYRPSSPYSASKAAADHLVRAWHRTWGLPVVISLSGNNFGPHQFPEKLIPMMILSALRGRPLPVYGDGAQVRDWLFVDDHVTALRAVLERGRIGETYHVSGGITLDNRSLVHRICEVLDGLAPRADGRPHADGIVSVPDRPGHDRRYALDANRIRKELGWEPTVSIDDALVSTVQWYLDKSDWSEDALERRGGPAS